MATPWTRPEYMALMDKEEFLESADELLLMEYCRLGDMMSFIQKCVDKGATPEPQHLWRIFACRKRTSPSSLFLGEKGGGGDMFVMSRCFRC